MVLVASFQTSLTSVTTGPTSVPACSKKFCGALDEEWGEYVLLDSMSAVVSSVECIVVRRFRTCFIHSDRASVHERAVQGADRVLSLLGIRHLNEGEAACLTSVTIEHDRDRLYAAKSAESSAKFVFSRAKIQITYEDIDHRIMCEAF